MFTITSIQGFFVAALTSALCLIAEIGYAKGPARDTGAYRFKSIHVFSETDGERPFSGLVQAPDGWLYGTTQIGGRYSGGVAYKISGDGEFHVLHDFIEDSRSDAFYPQSGLLVASDGRLYGASWSGGTNYVGTIYRMSPSGEVTILHSFSLDGTDGCSPASLIEASDGNFYGTTTHCGTGNCGTIFRMSKFGHLKTLHSFSCAAGDGYPSYGPLTEASNGYLYGTTVLSGQLQAGAVFRISKGGRFKLLHTFEGPDGSGPWAGGLVQAQDSNLYGVTINGGSNDLGVMFSIALNGRFKLLHAFGAEVTRPYGPLVQGADGKFYGVSLGSGSGIVYRATPKGHVVVIHSFDGNDGSGPTGRLLFSTDGTLYGVTEIGGDAGDGNVFRMKLR